MNINVYVSIVGVVYRSYHARIYHWICIVIYDHATLHANDYATWYMNMHVCG